MIKYALMDQGLPEGFGSKLGTWDPERGWVPVQQGNRFQYQNISGVKRILISTENDPLGLISDLLEFYSSPFRFSYFIVSSTDVGEPSKYELQGLSREQLTHILNQFSEFFRSDARHHLWIHATGGGTLIYDEHDWIYAYGSQNEIASFLTGTGFEEKPPEIPFPHLHNEPRENDVRMRELLNSYEWKKSNVASLS
jgi:hypothetical protein